MKKELEETHSPKIITSLFSLYLFSFFCALQNSDQLHTTPAVNSNLPVNTISFSDSFRPCLMCRRGRRVSRAAAHLDAVTHWLFRLGSVTEHGVSVDMNFTPVFPSTFSWPCGTYRTPSPTCVCVCAHAHVFACVCVCGWTDGHASYCVTVGGTEQPDQLVTVQPPPPSPPAPPHPSLKSPFSSSSSLLFVLLLITPPPSSSMETSGGPCLIRQD